MAPTAPCVASGWPICRRGCRGQDPFCNSVERDPEATNNVQANFHNLVTAKKLHQHDVMLQDQPTAEYRRRACKRVPRDSVRSHGKDEWVRGSCTKSTLVSLDGWCCAELAQVVIIVVTLRTWFVSLTVSSSKAEGRLRIAPDCTSV